MPHLRLAVHEFLDELEVARRFAFDEVAGDRERAPAEPDHRALVGELAPDDANGFEQRRERLVGIWDAERLDRREGTHRALDHRADALDELHVQPHAQDGRHDVGEHDGGVDAVAADRLQRHLGAELWRARDLPERVPLADHAVLGERPARLAHEPHRCALDRLASRRADEEPVHDPVRLAARVERTACRPLGPRAVACAGSGSRLACHRRCGKHRDDRVARGDQHRLPLARREGQPDRLGRLSNHRPGARAGPARNSRASRACTDPAGAVPPRFRPVAEHRAWFSELGSPMLPVEVRLGHGTERPPSTCRRGSRRRPRGTNTFTPRTPRATRSSRDRSNGSAASCPGDRASSTRTRREPAASPAFGEPLLCPSILAGVSSSTASARLPACPPTRRRSTSRGSTTAGRSSELDRDPVVD